MPSNSLKDNFMGYINNYDNYTTSYQSVKTVSDITEVERASFYKKTYAHVALAILAFIGVEYLLLNFIPQSIIVKMVSGSWIWLLILGGFWLGSFLANKWAHSLNKTTQYLGLAVYVLLEAVIFMPMIFFALSIAGGEIISQAGIITLALFLGLTAVVFYTNTDFSFMRTVLMVAGFVSLGLIVAGAIFGFNLGLWFSVGMVVLAAGSILYETYNIKNEYTSEQYVGAALQLFASVMLLFWYILRILISRRD